MCRKHGTVKFDQKRNSCMEKVKDYAWKRNEIPDRQRYGILNYDV